MNGEIAKRLVEIAAVGDQPPSPGTLSGHATAERWRKDFLDAQTAWNAYDERACLNVVDYDYYGGSAGPQFATACRIRHIITRINEIRGN